MWELPFDGLIFHISNFSEIAEEREKKLEELRNSGSPTEEVIKEFDLKILKQLDELVADQQAHLSCAHVPLFEPTTDPKKIKLQMEILDFINSLCPLMNKT